MQNRFKYRSIANIRFALLAAVVAVSLLEPAHAQAWAQKGVTVGQQIADGLKMLGRIVAIVVGSWGGLMIMAERKRFADMMNWFVGAGVFLAITEVAGLFFGS